MGLGERESPDATLAKRRVSAAVVAFAGAVVAAAAWAALVTLAVHWGREADDLAAWALTGAAGVAGVCCMLVVFALLSRSRALLNGTAPPRRAPGHRRR